MARIYVKKEITLVLNEQELNLIIISLRYRNTLFYPSISKQEPTEEENLLNQLETFKQRENIV